MPAPERRSRLDMIVTAVLAVAVLAVSGALWWTSDARHTPLPTAAGSAPGFKAPGYHGSANTLVPPSLAEAWRAPSPATPVPLVQGGTVITGDGGVGARPDP